VARLEIQPFSDAHLEDAARLLAARHARHRAAELLLSPRYEQPAEALAEVEKTWRSEAASGAAATRGGRLVGYLVGAPRTHTAWGDNTWIEASGHAVEEAEDVRDLYGSVAGRWVEEGRPRHSVLVPAWDGELLDAWSRVSFGKQHAHGVQEVRPPGEVSIPEGVEIREPQPDDVEQLIDVDLALPRHQRASPVFGSHGSWTRDESRAEWHETLGGDTEKVLIGTLHGRPVAAWSLVDVSVSGENRGLIVPDHACHLGFASTLPEARGSGIGVALTQVSFAWAAEHGYPAMVTDWRVTNLLSSRFWPRRGFRTSFLRLYRSIP
jgi:ribosomal protein S18 acetylase RimI-like enzyme